MNDNHGPDGKFCDGPSTSERYAQAKDSHKSPEYMAAKMAAADLNTARKKGDSHAVLHARVAYERAKVAYWKSR